MGRQECNIPGCDGHNDDTAKFTIDLEDMRYMCDDHWGLFLQWCRSWIHNACIWCERNHLAEADIRDVKQSTIKLFNKYYNLCPKHIKEYEDKMNYYSSKFSKDFRD